MNSSARIKLATHNNSFHLDEVVSTCILLRIFPNSTLMRTRNPKILDQSDIIYDVGGVYDPQTGRYDHHQRGFIETFSPRHTTKLSSAGLVYKHFSNELLESYQLEQSEDVINYIYDVYFEAIDAQDNGIEDDSKFYKRGLPEMVKDLNEESLVTGKKISEAAEKYKNFICSRNPNDRDFLVALMLVSEDMDLFFGKKRIFFQEIKDGDELVKNADSNILIVEEMNLLREAIFFLEKKHDKDFLFIIYTKKDQIRIYTALISEKSFEIKCRLHPDWCGRRDEDLQNVSKIPGASFVHANGFTGGASNIEDAVKMCQVSIDHHKNQLK